MHDHEDVLASLAEIPRIEVVKLPTYAPWLNPIEKLWCWLRQAVLKMRRLAEDKRQLRQRVNQFLDQFQNGSQELFRYVGLLGEGRLACPLRIQLPTDVTHSDFNSLKSLNLIQR